MVVVFFAFKTINNSQYHMNISKKFLLGFSLISIMFVALLGCSDKDEFANATHIAAVTPIGFGEMRTNNMKIYVSESPFESFDTFAPLTSVNMPEKWSITDSVRVNVSDYVGKTLYFAILRKKLLSDDYYSVMYSGGSQKLTDIKIKVEETVPHYKLAFLISEPTSGVGGFTQDKAKMVLTVKKGSAVVPNTMVYYYGGSVSWSEEMKALIERRYMVDGSIVQTKMAATNASGTVTINIPVNELGNIVSSDGKVAKNNEHVFFVLEDGKVKPVVVDVKSLDFAATLQY